MRDWRWPRLWLGVWGFGWLLCMWLSLRSPVGLPSADKLGHLAAYAALSAWATMLFRPGRAQGFAALSLLGLGIAMEFAQAAFTTDRLFEWADALADGLGILLGLPMGEPLARALARLETRRRLRT